MPGAMSDKDREFLVSMTPQLSTTPEGRKLMIAVQKSIAKRNREIAKDARDYARKNRGQLDVGFEDFVAEKYGGKDIFADLYESLPANTPAFEEGKTYRDKETGARVRYENGEFVEIE